jgi:TPR repeat protein
LAALLALQCGVAHDESCVKSALGLETVASRQGGVRIREVLPGGPADVAGLREGDVLVQIGERRIAYACEAEALSFNRECAPVRVVVERDGVTIEKTLAPADQSSLYETACSQGNAGACFRMAWLSEDPETMRTLFDDACARGSAEACAARGHALMTEQSPDAVPVLRKACDGGSGAGCAHLAYLYAEAILVPRDEIRAMELYTRACSLGDRRGCYSMGVFHDVGRGASSNHARAAAAYEEACNDGVSMACTDLGFLYERGRGVIADPSRAADLFRRGCEGSPCEPANLRGCVNLGDAYRDGIGVTQDDARAAEIFRTTCAASVDPQDTTGQKARLRACVLFAAFQISGRGIPQDEAAGLRASKEGCDKGDPVGCFNVALNHASRENYILAAAFFDRACEGGDAGGCYELGLLYDDAKGVPFDSDRAAALYRRACEGGFAKACDR